MNPIRKKSIIVGVLLILSIVVGILSIDPEIDELNNLENISSNSSAILIRALMQFILALIYACIPIILFALFKKINTGLMIGFLVFRIISVGFIFLGWLSILLLLVLSQEFIKAGSAYSVLSGFFVTFGENILLKYTLINNIHPFSFFKLQPHPFN